ncbi:uncharacterized protein V6R79_004651 [Siganus canaliculatus]
MTCSFRPAKSIDAILIINWEAYPQNSEGTVVNVATFYLNQPVDVAPSYEGRATLEVDVNGRQSTLSLTQVTMQDSRRYQCNVMIPNDDEGTTSATTSLLVLEPPSVPICKVQGTAEYYHDISLTCLSEEGSPKPVSEWTSYSVENIQRPFPPKTTEKDGVLSLINITAQTSGFFICTSTNRIGSASCNLTLSVMPPGMNLGYTIPIVAGVLIGVAIVGIIIYCCCKKKGKEDPNAEDDPEDAYHDEQAGGEYQDEKPKIEMIDLNKREAKDIAPQNNHNVGTVGYVDDDERSYKSGKERYDADSQRYKDDKRDDYRGSRDRLDEKRAYSGSRDRLDDQRERYGGSRDRLDDQRDRYKGSRDRLDDERDRYGGSRDRLDDQRDRYGGSRDRLDDRHDRYGGSRDRLDDRRDRYGGSRDRLDDHSDRYQGNYRDDDY